MTSFSIARLAFVLLTVISVWQCPLYAEHDFEITETIEFFITGSKTQEYKAYSLHNFTATYLSQRSMEHNVFTIGESYYQTISHIEAEQDDDRLPKSAFTYEYNTTDAFISDFKQHKITFPRIVRTGQSIAYSFRRDYRSIEFIPILHLANVDYIKEFKVVFHHPADVTIHFDTWFPRTVLPYSIDTTQPEQTTLTFSGIERSLPLKYFPFNDAQAFIRLQIARADTELTPSTPPVFAAWYRNLFDQQPALDSAHNSLLSEKIASAPTKRDKVAAIHDYVRSTIRYVAEEHGMNAIVPRPPSTVLHRGYGDCKDRAFLVASLARRYGIDGVFMALINTYPTPAFTGTHVNQFNHVICAFEENGRITFFDPTHKYSEFGNTPESDIDRPTLVLNPANARVVAVPRQNTLPAVEATISADINWPGIATAVITLRNGALASALQAIDNKQGMEIENSLSAIVTPNFHKIAFDNFVLQSRSDTAITLTADANLSSFIIASPTKKYIPHLPFRTVDTELIERDQDSLDLYLSFRDNYALTINLEIKGYASEPAQIAMGDMATTGFTASAQKSDSGMVLKYRYSQHTKVFAREKKKEFISFCKDVLKAKKNMFIFTKTEP